MSIRKLLSIVYCMMFAVLAVGCSKQEEIARYSVPRVPEKRTYGAIPDGGLERSAGKTARMLAAIVPCGHKTWFFKLIGPDDEVAARQAQFRKFIQSLRFPEETSDPNWELPAEWRQMPSSKMRFATLEIGPSDKPLEMTVTHPETGTEDVNEYVLSNINRWRDQLGLEQVASLEELTKTGGVSSRILQPGVSATVVVLTGRYGGTFVSSKKKRTATNQLSSNPPAGKLASE